MTMPAKQRRYEDRRKASGWKKASFWLPPDTLAALDRLAAAGMEKSAVVRAGIAMMDQPEGSSLNPRTGDTPPAAETDDPRRADGN